MFLSDLQTNITKKLFDSGIETSSLDSRIILKEIFCFDEKELILNSQLIVPIIRSMKWIKYFQED